MDYILPNRVYDLIKWFVTTVMPALTVLYVALAAYWGWPYAEKIALSIAAVYTCLCSIMGISAKQILPPSSPKHLGE